jgi:hypothetical protein
MRIITEVVDMATGDVHDVFPAGLPSGRAAGESSVDKEPASGK